MQQVEVTWPRVLSIALAILLANAVGSINGLIIGNRSFIAIYWATRRGRRGPSSPSSPRQRVLIWSVYVLRSALLKNYKDFRIELVAR